MMDCRHRNTLPDSHTAPNLLLVRDRQARSIRAAEGRSPEEYAVDEVGLAEALWCWPVEGYDLVLIDATEHPADGLELCDYIKKTRPAQKVAMVVGNRSGRFPMRSSADAVFAGEPGGPELVRAIRFLLQERSDLEPA